MHPLVSIIIPVYNAEKFLPKTIESAIAQTWQNKEIIIINDGSTDRSLEIAKSYVKDYIKVFTQINLGASSARNYGLNEAVGDYIQFLDSDDVLSPTKIEMQVNILEKNNDCVTSCSWARFRNETDEILGSIGPNEKIRKTLTPIEWLLTQHTMVIHGWLCPRKLIKAAGEWDEKISYNDDGEFFFRVVANAKKVIFVHEIFAFYRSYHSDHSLSNLNSRSKLESAYLASLTYRTVLYGLTNQSNVAQQAFGNYLKLVLFEAYPRYSDIVKMCLAHKEIKMANISYDAGGRLSKILIYLFGWELTKMLKIFYVNLFK